MVGCRPHNWAVIVRNRWAKECQSALCGFSHPPHGSLWVLPGIYIAKTKQGMHKWMQAFLLCMLLLSELKNATTGTLWEFNEFCSFQQLGKVACEATVNRWQNIASLSIGLIVHFHNYSALKCGNLRWSHPALQLWLVNEIETSSITYILAKSDLLPKPNTSPLIIYVNGKKSQQHLLEYVAK